MRNSGSDTARQLPGLGAAPNGTGAPSRRRPTSPPVLPHDAGVRGPALPLEGSFDCLSAPKDMVKAASDRGLTHLAITDHDRIDVRSRLGSSRLTG